MNTRQTVFLAVALALVVSFLVWAYFGFPLSFMKFFASDRDGTGTGQNDTNPPPIADVGGSSTCIPTIRSCNNGNVFQHYENCNGQDIEQCSLGCDPVNNNTEAVCIMASPTVPPGTTLTPTPDATPTVTPTATPVESRVCANLTSDKGGRVIINSKSGGGACINVAPGSSQTNSSNLTNTYSFPVGHVTRVYHDLTANCDYSYGNEAGGTKDMHGWTTIEPGQTKSFSETITAECGRYQIDFNVYNVDAACTADPRSDQFEYHSAMLFNTGVDCQVTSSTAPSPSSTPVPSASPTPTQSPSPTPTPSSSPTPTPPASPSPTPTPQGPRLSLVKEVRNMTQGSGQLDSVTASPLQTIEFTIRVTSAGSSAVQGVTLRDSLPSGLTYVIGSTTIDGNTASDGVTSTGLSLGDMASGRTISVRFFATVANASFFTTGITALTNTAFARGSNAAEVSDTAFVSVLISSSSPSMSLTKMGRNITRGELSETSPVRSSPGQTIGFVLRARNTSAAALMNAAIRDVLPAEIAYIPGTAFLNGAQVADTLVTSGITLGTLAPGQEVTLVFSGVVTGSTMLPAGTTTVINTGQLTATGVTQVTAQLPVVVINGAVSVPPVSTGPGDATVVAFLVSALVTLLYVGYVRTDMYRRREVEDLARRAHHEREDFRS